MLSERVKSEYKLYKHQEEAIRLIDSSRRSLVVSSPTGTGKTLIAYYAIARAVESGKSATYTSPLRALCNQKYNELAGKGYPNVVLSTGDKSLFEVVEEEIGKARVLVATFERLDSLTRRYSDTSVVREWIGKLGTLVVDEAHMVMDRGRGAQLEGAIARILSLNPEARIVMLGAAIGNPDTIANWVKGEVVSTQWRPVKLTVEIKPGRLGEDWVLHRIASTLRRGGNVLVFSFTRRDTVRNAIMLRRLVETVKPLSQRERGEVEKSAKRILSEARMSLTETLTRLMLSGVAFHHAGLPRVAREEVERLFHNRVLRVVTATTTLAYGVNYPARLVVIDGVKRFNPRHNMWELVPREEILNMCGRAGRPGYDPEGYVIILCHGIRDYTEATLEYRGLQPVVVESMLHSNLDSQVLATLACKPGYEFLEQWLKNTLAYITGKVTVGDLEATVKSLAEMGFTRDYEVTDYGRLVAKLYITPSTAKMFERMIPKVRDIREILYVIVGSPEVEGASVKDVEAVKMWISGVPERTILDRLGVEPGRLYYLTETLEWLAYSFSRIAEYHDYKDAAFKALALSKMLRYGVPFGKAMEAYDYERKHNIPKHKIRRIVLAKQKA